MLGFSEQKEGAQFDVLLPARSHKGGEVQGALFLVFCNDGGGVTWGAARLGGQALLVRG